MYIHNLRLARVIFKYITYICFPKSHLFRIFGFGYPRIDFGHPGQLGHPRMAELRLGPGAPTVALGRLPAGLVATRTTTQGGKEQETLIPMKEEVKAHLLKVHGQHLLLRIDGADRGWEIRHAKPTGGNPAWVEREGDEFYLGHTQPPAPSGCARHDSFTLAHGGSAAASLR